jgi:hypothetical protein
MLASEEQIVLALAVLLCIVFAVALPGFLTASNIPNLVRSVCILGILGVAMALVVIGRTRRGSGCHARELAQEIRRCGPEAVRAIKALTAPSPERNRRLEAELERFAEHVRGSDLSKGLTAFREKRPVQY